MVMALALSLVAVALVLRSTAMLRLAQRDLRQTQLEYALSGAQLAAATAVELQTSPGPYAWSFNVGSEAVFARAEPEGVKASLGGAAAADVAFFQRLGVNDVGALRFRLKQAAQLKSPDVSGLDPAHLWRACAARFVSLYGGDHLPETENVASAPGAPNRPTPRANEIWRVEVTSVDGWTDDRIVRLTGQPDRPAAVIARRFVRTGDGGGTCDHLSSALLGG